jgi:hypothetical protein
MDGPFREAQFQPQDSGDLGELVDGGVRLALLNVRDPAQGNSRKLSQIPLAKAEELSSEPHFFSYFLVCHFAAPLQEKRTILRLSPLSSCLSVRIL